MDRQTLAVIVLGALAAICLAILGFGDLESTEAAWGFAGMCAGGVAGVISQARTQ